MPVGFMSCTTGKLRHSQLFRGDLRSVYRVKTPEETERKARKNPTTFFQTLYGLTRTGRETTLVKALLWRGHCSAGNIHQ